MNLNDDAMLVSLRITAWSGRLYDREASNHVAVHHDAAASAGRYNKRLLPKAAFAALTATMSEARTKHYSNTLPWYDQGSRLLTVANYEHYTELLDGLRERVVRQRARFIEDYDDYVDQARLDLGKLFRIEDYPSKEALQGKFAIRYRITPVPDADHFIAKLASDDTDRVKRDIEQQTEERLHDAVGDFYRRLGEAVERVSERLQMDADARAGDGGDSAEAPVDITAEEQAWDEAMHQALNIARAEGKVPGQVEETVQGAHASTLDWRTLLRRYMTDTAKRDYTWSQPNRRFIDSGLYLPAMHSEAMGTIVVLLDTSGSVYSYLEILASFWTEVREVAHELNPERVIVLQVDRRIAAPSVSANVYRQGRPDRTSTKPGRLSQSPASLAPVAAPARLLSCIRTRSSSPAVRAPPRAEAGRPGASVRTSRKEPRCQGSPFRPPSPIGTDRSVAPLAPADRRRQAPAHRPLSARKRPAHAACGNKAARSAPGR